eukprot:Cvel_8170.t2-p1 / transcript=Cvel_8170.t2 / gene=Cvel_8170 / organism=Chromera_velia_CCMP2878 / gene_product=hypothetical protein / transcript_product=hypothetical protein / location=Cvel_scaffold445:44061-44729(-) / protein_length=223 / sequence_SO=supercontig / SO=protein_coding / is_pseudo=false
MRGHLRFSSRAEGGAGWGGNSVWEGGAWAGAEEEEDVAAAEIPAESSGAEGGVGAEGNGAWGGGAWAGAEEEEDAVAAEISAKCTAAGAAAATAMLTTGTSERLRRDSVGGSTLGDSCTSGAASAEGSAAALLSLSYVSKTGTARQQSKTEGDRGKVNIHGRESESDGKQGVAQCKSKRPDGEEGGKWREEAKRRPPYGEHHKQPTWGTEDDGGSPLIITGLP